ALDRAGCVRGAHHAAAHAHGDRGDGGGLLEERPPRGNGAPGKIHILELGKVGTANAITHDGLLRQQMFVWMEMLGGVGTWARTAPSSARQPKRTAKAACAVKFEAKPVPRHAPRGARAAS